MNLSQQNPQNPALVDLALIEINEYLKLQFSWLDQAFGKAQKLTRQNEKKINTFYPGVFAGFGKTLDKDYQALLPDDTLGNFSFWNFEDPFQMSGTPNGFWQGTANVSLILWFDLRKIFPEAEKRNIEKLKEDIANALYNGTFKTSSLKIDSVFEDVNNVYRGYSVSEVKQQFAMQPFGCLRFSGKLLVRTFC